MFIYNKEQITLEIHLDFQSESTIFQIVHMYYQRYYQRSIYYYYYCLLVPFTGLIVTVMKLRMAIPEGDHQY